MAVRTAAALVGAALWLALCAPGSANAFDARQAFARGKRGTNTGVLGVSFFFH